MRKLKILRLTDDFLTKVLICLLMLAVSISAQEKLSEKTKSHGSEKDNQKAKPTKLPTAQEILDKYVQALGGRDANLKVKTKILKGDIEIPQVGIKGKFESYLLEPDKSYTKTTLQGIGELIDVCDGVNAWVIDPITGIRKKEGDELEQAKIEALMHKDVNLEKIYSSFEVKGIEKIGSDEAYVVAANRERLPANVFYFDTKTGLLLAVESILITPQGKIPSKSVLSDWREIQGVKVPFQTTIITPQYQVVIKLNSAELNKEVDPKLFEAPEWVRK